MSPRILSVVGAVAGAVALCVVATVAATLATAAESPADAPLFEQPGPEVPNLTGKWAMEKPARALTTTSAAEPPLTAAGRTEYRHRQAALKKGDHSIDPISQCLLHGTPRLLYAPYPFLILQTTRSVDFVHEANHTFRIVYWDKVLPDEPDPTYLGSSIARFEGKTLVIDTIGFNDKTWLDYSGLPHGEKLKVEERYTQSAPDTIHGTLKIEDPDYYTRAWTTTFTLKKQPGMSLRESACMDTHRM